MWASGQLGKIAISYARFMKVHKLQSELCFCPRFLVVKLQKATLKKIPFTNPLTSPPLTTITVRIKELATGNTTCSMCTACKVLQTDLNRGGLLYMLFYKC